MLQVLDSTNIPQHSEPQSGAILGRILAPKIAPKPLQLPQKNNTNINADTEQPKQLAGGFWPNQYRWEGHGGG